MCHAYTLCEFRPVLAVALDDLSFLTVDMGRSLVAEWPQLRGETGLTGKHSRIRLESLQSVQTLFDDGSFDDSEESFLRIASELLDLLLFTLALSDSNWLVRKSAIQSGYSVFNSIQRRLPVSELDRFIWGFLATNVDEHKEVQDAAANLFARKDSAFVDLCSEEMLIRLIHKFVTRSMLSMKTPDLRLLLFSVEGALKLQLLDISESAGEVALVVIAASALLNEYEIAGDKLWAIEVSRLLRLIGGSQYRRHIISMIQVGCFEGISIAKHYCSDSIGEETTDAFKKLPEMVILKGVSIALESVASVGTLLASESLTKENLKAVQKLIELLQIPPELVVPTDDAGSAADHFSHSSFFLLRILDSILSVDIVEMKQQNLLQDILLICATIASAEYDAKTPLSWIKRDTQAIAIRIMEHLDIYLDDKADLFDHQKAGRVRNLKVGSCVGIEKVISKLLPDLLPTFKTQLKTESSIYDKTSSNTTPRSVRLASAIISAHQMCWCIKQVKHPHLSPYSALLIPCVLMALDHYSLHIKRQALKSFIHLRENLNPSELRWYKDIILDCISRNINAHDELWSLVVVTAVQLLKCLEGHNPRAKWYRTILGEMLSELERHRRDPSWYAIWLQHIGELLEMMGLVIVYHFRRLLPLLFLWLHTSDDKVTLMVLQVLKTIIRNAWPRIPYHVERFWQELAQLYVEASERKSSSTIRSSIIDVCVLLKTCSGATFESLSCKEEKDSLSCLKNALNDHFTRVSN